MEVLYLQSNNIVDISFLGGMTGIDKLYLDNNSITTRVADLIGLTSAALIDLFNSNSIPCADLAKLMTALSGVVKRPSNCII